MAQSSSLPAGPADLFLFMGQSNMAGRGVTCSRFPQSAPACLPGAGWEFRAVSDPNRLYPAAESALYVHSEFSKGRAELQ